MSIEKGRGYGTRIMKAISLYLDQLNIPALGNTWIHNFDFYKKCGYTFVHSLMERMVYITPNGEKRKTERENYDMFIYDLTNQLSNLVNGDEEIIIKVPFWQENRYLDLIDPQNDKSCFKNLVSECQWGLSLVLTRV